MSQTFEPQILNHPLIQHKISLMRKKETGSKDFRELASEVLSGNRHRQCGNHDIAYWAVTDWEIFH